ncbi:MAG: flippase-like domain-containing protein, partial [Anaerolineales bacterium]|nr:flippase-like domain-containing protein [Anaerolineales bacterium]
MKRILSFIGKAVVSVALIWYLLSITEFSAVFASLASATPFWLFLSFITLILGKIITSYRWQVLLKAQEIEIPLRFLIGSVFVGQFFNSFLPTTIGGDAMRAYDTATLSQDSTKSVVSVFADRLIGVFALALLAVVALGIGFASGLEVSFYVIPVLLVFFLCSFGILLIFNARLLGFLQQLLGIVRLDKAAAKLDEAYQSFNTLRTEPRVLTIAMLASLVLQINVILFYYFIGVSLDLGVSFLYFAMIVPVALVVLLVPFSINGIGIREGIFVYLLTGIGVPTQ